MARDRLDAPAMLSMKKNLIQTFLTLTPKSLRGLLLRKTEEQSSCSYKSCHSLTHSLTHTHTHTHTLTHSITQKNTHIQLSVCTLQLL